VADPNKYKIIARPSYQSVSPGALIDYYCAQQYSTYEAPGPTDRMQWYCYNDRTTAQANGQSLIVKGPALALWKEAKWDFEGLHTLICEVDFKDGGKITYQYPQSVEATGAILGRELTQADRQRANPESVMDATQRYIAVLEQMPVSADAKARHEEQLDGYKKYASALKGRLKSTEGWARYPIGAVHLETTTQQRSPLRVFIAEPRTAPIREYQLKLVDWTNPLDRTRTGEYEASGDTPPETLRKLIKAWDSGNRYPDGSMAYKVPFYVAVTDMDGQFATDGSSTWDSITTFLDWLALGAAVVAGVVTLVAPVPGSQFVSFAIWTSIFSSTAAATINIAQRHAEGFGNFRDDAFDGLTILSNIFAAGSAAWIRQGSVLTRTSPGGKILKFCLIGQIAGDGVQGVLVLEDHIADYDRIMSDQSLTPDERAKKLLALFGSLATTAAIIALSVKGNKADLDNLNKAPKHLTGPEAKSPKDKLEALKNKDGPPLDATKPPKVEAETKQGRQKAVVNEEPARPPPKKVKTFESEYPPDEDFWRVHKIEKDQIWLQHAHPDYPNNPRMDYVFQAKIDGDGKVKITVRTKDGEGTPSPRLKGGKLYEMMFEHFPANGHPIKGWHGELAWDNYKEVMKAIKAGDAPEVALLKSVTGEKFWVPWAERNNLAIIVKEARADEWDHLFYFDVEFVPKGK
jgi:hypothetical protein